MKRLEQKDLRRTIVLTGTRRVGKTTIQYQMIDRLLKKGVPPQKILFVSMDHPMLKLSGLNDLLECYHSNVYAEQDCYYFFDEIQYASDWDKWMKRFMTCSRKQKWLQQVGKSCIDERKLRERCWTLERDPGADVVFL